MAGVTSDVFSTRITKLPKCACDYIQNIHTFVGAEEVQELTFCAIRTKRTSCWIDESREPDGYEKDW